MTKRDPDDLTEVELRAALGTMADDLAHFGEVLPEPDYLVGSVPHWYRMTFDTWLAAAIARCKARVAANRERVDACFAAGRGINPSDWSGSTGSTH